MRPSIYPAAQNRATPTTAEPLTAYAPTAVVGQATLCRRSSLFGLFCLTACFSLYAVAVYAVSAAILRPIKALQNTIVFCNIFERMEIHPDKRVQLYKNFYKKLFVFNRRIL